MEKRKFKVGERYKSGIILDNAAVIEITEINGDFVSYKDVVRETIGRKIFEIGSIFSDNLEKVGSETIVIYRKDNKVIALDKSTGEKAEAKCNPADEFDFRTGAKLAFNRLMGKDVKSDNGVREVKRKAKVGEYIKIVDAMPFLISYKNGDIFKVISTDKGGCYSKYSTWSGLGNYRQNFVKGVSVEDGMVAKVLNISKHDNPYITLLDLVLIQNPKTTQVFIINIDGIKKVER